MTSTQSQSITLTAVSINKPGVLRQPGVVGRQRVGRGLGRAAGHHQRHAQQEEEEEAAR